MAWCTEEDDDGNCVYRLARLFFATAVVLLPLPSQLFLMAFRYFPLRVIFHWIFTAIVKFVSYRRIAINVSHIQL